MKIKVKAVLILFAWALIVSHASAYTIYGDIINVSSSTNGWQCPTCINLFGEPGTTVMIKYTNVNGTPIQTTTTTDALGSWHFDISDYVPFSLYSLDAVKGTYQSPTATWNFPDAGAVTSQYKGALTISDKPVVIRIIPSLPIINKGDSVIINITVEPNNNPVSGVQVYPNYGAWRLSLKNGGVSEGNFLNKASSTFWQNGTSTSGKHVIFGATLGMGSQSATNGTFATLNMSGTNNGTVNFTVDSIGIVSRFASRIRTIVYPASVKITQPWDINGDYVDNIQDLSIWNSYNATGVCPAAGYNRCLGTNKTDIMAHYGQKVNIS